MATSIIRPIISVPRVAGIEGFHCITNIKHDGKQVDDCIGIINFIAIPACKPDAANEP